MLALDTNVLVRYLAQDDAKQSAAATRRAARVLTLDAKAAKRLGMDLLR